MPIFKYSTPRVVQAVITSLVPEIYVSGDFIVRAGSPNSAMYFIRDGRCSVLLDDPDPAKMGIMHRVNTLRRNAHFGELSLFSESHKATASILADTNVDVHALYKHEFEKIKCDFPEARRAHRSTSLHSARSPLLHTARSPLLHTARRPPL